MKKWLEGFSVLLFLVLSIYYNSLNNDFFTLGFKLVIVTVYLALKITQKSNRSKKRARVEERERVI